MIQILHNSRCSKSREALEMLRQSGEEFEIINYLENPPSPGELEILLKKLAIRPLELVRQKEPLWISEYKGKTFSDQEIIQILSENPILIERPIIINGDKAVIARPASDACSII